MTSRLPPHLAVVARAPSSGRGAAEAPQGAGPAAPGDPALREEARFAGVAADAAPLTRELQASADAMMRVGAELSDFARRRIERNLRTWERLAACRNPADAAAAWIEAWFSAAEQYAEAAATLSRIGRRAAASPGAASPREDGARPGAAERGGGRARCAPTPPTTKPACGRAGAGVRTAGSRRRWP
jgi:hypothetical protein